MGKDETPLNWASRHRIVAHYTRFGRYIYSLGGDEQSATLMGLPVGRTKIFTYTVSGFCSALAGVV